MVFMIMMMIMNMMMLTARRPTSRKLTDFAATRTFSSCSSRKLGPALAGVN